MYCAGRERAAQPGAPALPAARAVWGGLPGKSLCFSWSPQVVPTCSETPPISPEHWGEAAAAAVWEPRERGEMAATNRCAARGAAGLPARAARASSHRKAASARTRRAWGRQDVGQAGLGLCRIRPSSSSLSCRSPQWPWGRCPQSQDMPRHVSSCVVFSSAKAPTAAPLLWEQPVFLTTCPSPQLCCS